MKTKTFYPVIAAPLVVGAIIILPLTAHAQKTVVREDGLEVEIIEIKPEDIRYSRGDVDRILREIVARLKGDSKDELQSVEISSFCGKVKRLIGHREIENQSGYSREWLKNIGISLQYMAQARQQKKLAIDNRDRKRLQNANAAYEKGLNKFAELLKNPERVEKEETRRSSRRRG